MRIMAGDPGAHWYRVFLDGIERDKVIIADEEDRYIVRYKTDERGFLIKSADGENLLTEKLQGDVSIREIDHDEIT